MDRYQKEQEDVEGEGTRLARLKTGIRHYTGIDQQNAELLFVPEDLQTADPSLLGEIQSGHFGLDGIFLEVGEGLPSIFEHPEADEGFNRALFGFGWLRDLEARGDFEAQLAAQKLVYEWIYNFSERGGIGDEPRVLARRILSFLSHSPFVLRGVRRQRSGRFKRMLASQIHLLSTRLDQAPEGLPRLDVLSTLVMAGLCLSQHEQLLSDTIPLLLHELEQQVLEDGGHCSRNPGALLHILFGILPLKRCFEGRGKEVPKELLRAVDAMIAMTRFLRMGDSSLARFNGHSVTPTNALATLLTHYSSPEDHLKKSPQIAIGSGYYRLQAGPSILICDVGSPPPVSIDARAHAGCLSFELSVRHFALVVNAGAFMEEDEEWQRYARSTRAHSTLTIDNHSSGGFLNNGHLIGPHEVLVEETGPLSLKAAHKGYESRFGFTHFRSCTLSPDGLRLAGRDRLEKTGQEATQAGDLSFQIRFHLHPFIELAISNATNLLLTLPDGEIWRFTARGARLSVEDSVYLAYRGGPEVIHQITLEGPVGEGADVNWTFEQYSPRPEILHEGG